MAVLPGDPPPYWPFAPTPTYIGPPPRDMGELFLKLLKKRWIDDFAGAIIYSLTENPKYMIEGLTKDQINAFKRLVEDRRSYYSDQYLDRFFNNV
jgi:hypothetical protein